MKLKQYCLLTGAVLAAWGFAASAQPTFGNPSPTAGSSTSQKANAAADTAAYRPVEYQNKGKQGPALIVIPGEIKSANSNFMQKFGPNNIADYAELELTQANFPVIERSNLGPMLNEIALAYNLGDPKKARATMQTGQLKSTRWIIRFDILKAEEIASATQGVDGRPAGGILGALGAGIAGRVVGSARTSEASKVWLIGMRYKIMDAVTTEQVAQGYTEEKMEVGAQSSSVMGVSQGQKGGVGLDTMVQRLVQKSVWEIDSRHK
jgi:hypothetical protein